MQAFLDIPEVTVGERKVIQIACLPADSSAFHHSTLATLYALCDDGTIWAVNSETPWHEVGPVPPPSPSTP